MHACFKNARSVSLIALLAISACSGKKRNFVDDDSLTTESTDGGAVDPSSLAPDSPETPATDPGALGSEGAQVPLGSGICDESGSCRCDESSESCEATALCTNGDAVCDETCPGCLIEGACVEARALNPANNCLICDPNRGSRDWSSNDGASCDDGLFCTTNDACLAGVCTGAALLCEDNVACNGVSTCDDVADACSTPTSQCPAGQVCDVTTDACTSTCDGCLINNVCFSAGSERAGDPCMVCDPAISSTAFVPAVGKVCGAGDAACSLADTCDAQGLCQPNHLPSGTACGDPASGPCNQSDACDGSGTCSPRVIANTTPCDDGSFCTVGDQCQGGQCVPVGSRNCGTDLACDEAADQCRCQGCVIGNRCVARGTVNTANPCQICDPARSTSAFSPNVNALCGAGPTECSGQDTCNAQGQCQANDSPVGTPCSSVPDGQCQPNGQCVDPLAGRQPLELAAILEERGAITFDGAQMLDNAGLSLASGGDVNGDGIDDVVIGTNGGERNGVPRSGLAYVVFGTRQPTSVSLQAVEAGQGGFIIAGAAEGDSLGRSVAMAGDVNGDGLDDVVVGASGTPSGENFGAAYVVFGKRSTTAISVSAVASGQGGGFAINGVASQSRLGTVVASAGDVNGDGRADVIVQVDGARAGARVVFGRSGSAPVDAEALQGGGFAILSGVELITAVAGVGDVNGDSFDDLGLGASGASVAGNPNTGRAYVVFGRSVGSAVDLSAIQTGQPGGFAMTGVRGGDLAGGSISKAGDVNQDGLTDLVVSANRAPSNGNAAVGKAYVVFGRANSTPLQLAAIEEGAGNGFVINGVSTEDATGLPSAGVGDVNNDGIDDIAVSAFAALSFSGVTSIVYGKNDSGAVSLIDLRLGGRGGFAINGANAFEGSGVALGTGDFDGDGLTDLFLGASLGSPGDRSTAGRVYAIFGRYIQ